MNADNPDSPRIIVDDDWKARVQAEKEALERQRGGGAAATENDLPPPAAAKAPAQGDQPESDDQPDSGDQLPPAPPPPATFEQLVANLAMQASYTLLHAGGSPDEAQRQLAWARYYIDTLQVLEAKTQGRLDAEESQLLTSVLHELRMACVETQTRLSSAPTRPRP